MHGCEKNRIIVIPTNFKKLLYQFLIKKYEYIITHTSWTALLIHTQILCVSEELAIQYIELYNFSNAILL